MNMYEQPCNSFIHSFIQLFLDKSTTNNTRKVENIDFFFVQ